MRARLHVIRGRAELLARHESLSDKERRNLEIISEQIDRITVQFTDSDRVLAPKVAGTLALADAIGATVAEYPFV